MKTVVFFGDSITEFAQQRNGYLDLIKRSLSSNSLENEYSIIGSGWRGDKVSDLLQRVDKDVIKYLPDIVFIYIGINDVWHHSSMMNMEREKLFKVQYQELIEKIKSKTKSEIVLCTPSVIGEKIDDKNLFDSNLDRYSYIIKTLAVEEQLRLCDLRALFLSYLKENNNMNLASGIVTIDGVHLNKEGNQIVAEAFYTLLLSMK